MSLANKVVLITGAGTGIGADTARAFHDAGSYVVLNGRREAVLQETASLIDPSGQTVAIVPGDIGIGAGACRDRAFLAPAVGLSPWQFSRRLCVGVPAAGANSPTWWPRRPRR